MYTAGKSLLFSPHVMPAPQAIYFACINFLFLFFNGSLETIYFRIYQVDFHQMVDICLYMIDLAISAICTMYFLVFHCVHEQSGRERTVFYSNRDRCRFRQTGTGTGSTLDRTSVLKKSFKIISCQTP